jgi:hypothetical protein
MSCTAVGSPFNPLNLPCAPLSTHTHPFTPSFYPLTEVLGGPCYRPPQGAAAGLPPPLPSGQDVCNALGSATVLTLGNVSPPCPTHPPTPPQKSWVALATDHLKVLLLGSPPDPLSMGPPWTKWPGEWGHPGLISGALFQTNKSLGDFEYGRG